MDCRVVPVIWRAEARRLVHVVPWEIDILHLLAWFVLVGAFGLVLIRRPLGRLNLFALAIGFGALTAILWELLEYVTFLHARSSEFHAEYTDTLLDLLLSLVGSTLAALVVVAVFWPRVRRPSSPARAG